MTRARARVARLTPEQAQRRNRVVEMRAQRFSFAAIGEELGITKQRAAQLYEAALSEMRPAGFETYRQEELELIDRATRNLIAIAEDPDPEAVPPRDRVKAWTAAAVWAQRKAKLLALDPAPLPPSGGGLSVEALDREIHSLQVQLGESA